MGDIPSIEKRLWSTADNLRANSNYASNEYFLPVMGLIFLRHAYSRYLAVRAQLERKRPTRGGKALPLSKEDFSGKGAIYLRPEARFDYLVGLRDSDDRAAAVIHAMESIEKDYETLQGVLPKGEYQELDNEVLGQLLRTFDDQALREATGDVFGRIYEYFLTGFADLKAHDNGEFFTPVSLVQMIVNVIEPDHGRVLDPACGSGGMFVQSAHFVEQLHQSPTERLTFYGMEKNPTTIRLAKMNLAVHGLEGDIQKAITYYEDPHELQGRADFVMANPPFNVDEVDAGKVRNDPRLPYGPPGVNKQKKVSNGNYLWISYFDSYLSETGRAGFVMSSQASSAGRDEAKVRRKLVESGHVDAMIAIRSNFFYTRTVPCELWFLDKGKAAAPSPSGRGPGVRGPGTVLMIDARNVYRKVTRKIYDFSPEQLANLTAIVWLYRGQRDRFLDLVSRHLDSCLYEAQQTEASLAAFLTGLDGLTEALKPFLDSQPSDGAQAEPLRELTEARRRFADDSAAYHKQIDRAVAAWEKTAVTSPALHKAAERAAPIAEQSRDLVKDADQLYKLATRLIDTCEQQLNARQSDRWSGREVNRARKALEDARQAAVEQLKQVRYFHKQAHWLQERFPEAELRDVEGLVKLVSVEEIERNDWSLTPGRYVGVTPEVPDEDFDFEETLREIHVELADLNREAAELAARIQTQLAELA